MNHQTPTPEVSWLRVAFITCGLLAALPLTLLWGVVGLIASLGFVFLAALAK